MREAGVRWRAKGSRVQWPVGLTACVYECFCSHREHGGGGVGKVCRNCPPPGSRQMVVACPTWLLEGETEKHRQVWGAPSSSKDRGGKRRNPRELALPAPEALAKGRQCTSELGTLGRKWCCKYLGTRRCGEKRHVVHLGFITVCWGAGVAEGGEQRSKGNKDVKAWKLSTEC